MLQCGSKFCKADCSSSTILSPSCSTLGRCWSGIGLAYDLYIWLFACTTQSSLPSCMSPVHPCYRNWLALSTVQFYLLCLEAQTTKYKLTKICIIGYLKYPILEFGRCNSEKHRDQEQLSWNFIIAPLAGPQDRYGGMLTKFTLVIKDKVRWKPAGRQETLSSEEGTQCHNLDYKFLFISLSLMMRLHLWLHLLPQSAYSLVIALMYSLYLWLISWLTHYPPMVDIPHILVS